MAWTYDSTNLAIPLNQLRLMVGDTNPVDPQMTDEELTLFLDSAATVQDAAQSALRAMAARYARDVDKWVGDLKILKSQRHRAILAQLEKLETAAFAIGIPSAGGIRYSQKESNEGDTDLVVPSFRRNLFDFEDEPS